MSRFIQGNCVDIMSIFPERAVDFILTDPPYLVGHLVFTKTYSSKSAYVGYRHECACILAKGRPALPLDPLPDVLGWKYSGNRHHPTEKPVTSLQLLIESFTHPNAIVLDPFAGSGSTCVAAVQAGRRYIGIELMGAVS